MSRGDWLRRLMGFIKDAQMALMRDKKRRVKIQQYKNVDPKISCSESSSDSEDNDYDASYELSSREMQKLNKRYW